MKKKNKIVGLSVPNYDIVSTQNAAMGLGQAINVYTITPFGQQLLSGLEENSAAQFFHLQSDEPGAP